jgi:D-alanyl-lipoteichoic acid acyltransferase DltB (MBOAT superfamily)
MKTGIFMPLFHILLFCCEGQASKWMLAEAGSFMALQFTTIFFLIVMLLLFQLLKGNSRRVLLLLGSILFICYEGGILGIAAIVFVTLFTWKAGEVLFLDSGAFEEKRRKKIGACIVISILSLTLFGWKYIPWIAQQLGMDLGGAGLLLPVPIGLSFYVFQAISYIADLYLGRIQPEKSLTSFALYMTWFPKWMSGPIERAENFIGQLKYLGNIRPYSFNRITTAASFLVWGLFMKLLIADKAGKVADTVFGDISSMGAVAIVAGSLLYTVQIYCDFAGYTNIVMGISKFFGIDLTQNFRTPYMAENIVDFWRRWHISLSSFLRQYIYIPLGGNRKGAVRKYINMLAVFLICGMWHGAGLSFIVWGLLHAFYNIAASFLKGSRFKFLTEGMIGRLITFCSVSIAWIFFRAESLTQALAFIKGMIPAFSGVLFTEGLTVNSKAVLGLGIIDWWILGIGILVLAMFDAYAYRKDSTPPLVMIERLSPNRRIVLLAVVLSLVLIFGEYGSGEEIRKFVYMNF